MAQRRRQRRHEKWLRRNRAVVLAAISGAAAAFGWFAVFPDGRRPPEVAHPVDPYVAVNRGAGSASVGEPDADAVPARVVLYPYSVIPGGVADVAELRVAIRRDPVVARHYAGFDLRRAELVLLTADRSAYVSYRRGDEIFWTTRKLKLREGEAVITDGVHTARTRCGNLVANAPPGPISPGEPDAELLDTPLPVDLPQDPTDLIVEAPPADPILSAPGPEFPVEWVGIAGPPTIVGIDIHHPQPPALPTPEPEPLVLLAVGLGALWMAIRASRSGLGSRHKPDGEAKVAFGGYSGPWWHGVS